MGWSRPREGIRADPPRSRPAERASVPMQGPRLRLQAGPSRGTEEALPLALGQLRGEAPRPAHPTPPPGIPACRRRRLLTLFGKAEEAVEEPQQLFLFPGPGAESRPRSSRHVGLSGFLTSQPPTPRGPSTQEAPRKEGREGGRRAGGLSPLVSACVFLALESDSAAGGGGCKGAGWSPGQALHRQRAPCGRLWPVAQHGVPSAGKGASRCGQDRG